MRKLICLLICAALLAGLAACSTDEVAATVNGEKIMRSEVETLVKSMELKYTSYGVSTEDFYGDEASRAALYDGALESLIERRLLLDVAGERGLEPYTEAEAAELKAAGQAELDSFIEAAKGAEDVELSDVLALYGSTEQSYVSDYVAIAEYNRAYDFLAAAAKPEDADYIEYYDRLLEQQKATAADDPHYLGNYAEAGTLLYLPEGAVYAEYLLLGDEGAELTGYDELAALYTGTDEHDTALVFPGTPQFGADTVAAVTALSVGEATGRITDGGTVYMFRRIADPQVPASWQELPENMRESVHDNVAETYVAALIEAARANGEVTKHE